MEEEIKNTLVKLNMLKLHNQIDELKKQNRLTEKKLENFKSSATEIIYNRSMASNETIERYKKENEELKEKNRKLEEKLKNVPGWVSNFFSNK